MLVLHIFFDNVFICQKYIGYPWNH